MKPPVGPKPSNQSECDPNGPCSCHYQVIGFISGDFGLGEAGRHSLRRMGHLGIPTTTIDIDTGDRRSGQNQEFAGAIESPPHQWRGRINLFHLNPTEFERLVLRQHPRIPLVSKLNVIVPFWEIPVLPEDWLTQLIAMDCVLAPTRFIQDIVSQHCPGKYVIHYPQKVDVSEPAIANRPRFGVPEGAFVFLCAFDAMSDAARKNPWAVITAFKKAFTSDEGFHLVIKVANPQFDGVGEKLRQKFAGDSRIQLIGEMLPQDELRQLYASCDALVSLHRSEGLGFIIMEMMAQAKPCIVTGWSGNMDFTTEENSCLVDFKMVPMESNHPGYRAVAQTPGVQWADADIDSAVGWMRKLAADPGLCKRIGTQARQTMNEMSADDCAEVFAKLDAMSRGDFKRSTATRAHLRRLRRKHFGRTIKRFLRGKNWERKRKRVRISSRRHRPRA